MPACFAVIITKTRCGIHLVAFQTDGFGSRSLIATVNVIVADGNDERIFTVMDIGCGIQFENTEKAFVRTDETAVYENFGNIVHAVKM